MKKQFKNKKGGKLIFSGNSCIYNPNLISENYNKRDSNLISKLLPKNEFENEVELVKDLDAIYIGQFEELSKREIQSFFLDGAIFISNNFPNEDKMIETLIHEVSHCVENSYKEFLYSDGKLKEEFLGKRKTLYRLLSDYLKPGIGLEDFLDIDYNEEFDNFLYKDIGYDKLSKIINGLFPTPYSTTSLREYFAMGFEEYFSGDVANLKKVSPKLFNKINSLTKI